MYVRVWEVEGSGGGGMWNREHYEQLAHAIIAADKLTHSKTCQVSQLDSAGDLRA